MNKDITKMDSNKKETSWFILAINKFKKEWEDIKERFRSDYIYGELLGDIVSIFLAAITVLGAALLDPKGVKKVWVAHKNKKQIIP